MHNTCMRVHTHLYRGTTYTHAYTPTHQQTKKKSHSVVTPGAPGTLESHSNLRAHGNETLLWLFKFMIWRKMLKRQGRASANGLGLRELLPHCGGLNRVPKQIKSYTSSTCEFGFT